MLNKNKRGKKWKFMRRNMLSNLEDSDVDLKEYKYAKELFQTMNKQMREQETNPDSVFKKYINMDDGTLDKSDFKKTLKNNLNLRQKTLYELQDFLESFEDTIPYGLIKQLLVKYNTGKKWKFRKIYMDGYQGEESLDTEEERLDYEA